jgi:hypothetical protein
MNINQKGFANIAIIILLVVLIGAGGYFVLVKKPVDKLTPQEQSQVQNDTQRAQSPVGSQPYQAPQDETENWETYDNEKYGLKFKYPPSLTTRERERTHPTGNSFQVSFEEGNDLALTVVVYLKNPVGNIDQSLNYIRTNYKDVEKILVNDYQALRYFNGNNVIIFSDLKSYSFSNNFLGVVEPLTAEKFELIVSSINLD